MNAQERDQLNQFLRQLAEVKLTSKDPEAETLIRDAMVHQSDAAYLLVQRCLLQDQALRNAQAQIVELQNQLQHQQPTASNSSFLNDNPWAPPSTGDNRVPGASSYQMPNRTAPSNLNYAQAAPSQNQASGFGSSFLGNVATTAAGVVAGSFLFQGIENLLGHHSPSPWHSSTNEHQADAGEQHIPEQTVINNYYGDSEQALQHADYTPFPADDEDSGFFDDNNADSDWI